MSYYQQQQQQQPQQQQQTGMYPPGYYPNRNVNRVKQQLNLSSQRQLHMHHHPPQQQLLKQQRYHSHTTQSSPAGGVGAAAVPAASAAAAASSASSSPYPKASVAKAKMMMSMMQQGQRRRVLSNVLESREINPNLIIRDVWAENLEEEMRRIRDVVEEYPYIAMDTEFPGTVAKPTDTDESSQAYNYKHLKVNVDLLNIIQLGLTFCDEKGNLPPSDVCVWQFNFRFSLSEDMYAQDSIDFLRKSGIKFEMHEQRGIDIQRFGELLMMSGVVLSEDVTWVTFHSGYDYGYLLKLLTNDALPDSEDEFFKLFDTFFPCVYDVKYLMTQTDTLKGGLSKIAHDLEVKRVGLQHTAGSDALLTAACFFKMIQLYFPDGCSDHAGILYGYGMHSTTKGRSNSSKSS
eukprot:TRINITY_DN66132_c1_g2_i1.p1 TRINITY_DN66132_c1_g2~~TRINITY_DN66132_c1_g2_i1.p1  ORF type:complete len:403 (+),score=220.31 TRINITY_DN66132_c1_g2_i1:207-1415(+)